MAERLVMDGWMRAEEPGVDELVRRARGGDASAFEALALRYEPLLLRTGRFLLRDADAARDASQEVLLRAWRGFATYDGRAPMRAWLLSLLRHLCVDRWRSEASRSALEAAWAPQPGAPPAAGAGIARREREEALRAALAPLSDRQRLALVLAAREGMTSAEVAEVLDCSETTARVTLFRARRNARRALARALEEKGVALEDATRWLLDG